jgi:beta-mannosidase
MEYHQRSPNGNSLILHYMMDWFLLPTSFDMTLWLSQILQGMAIKHAVEHWRRTMPRGMGTLYWQLNDCWPVASWSSLDYYGRWKALHHMARHFFAPLMLSAVPDWDTGVVALHVTNDHLQPLSATIHWQVTTALGQPVTGGRTKAEIGPNQNNEITTLDLASQVEEYGRNDLLVWLQLETGGQIVSTNLAFFCRPKHLGLADPEISWELSPGSDNRTQITLTARKPALWAWLEIDGERLDTSDNFFHLQPGQPHTVTLQTTSPVDPAAITVHSLHNTYQPQATQNP